MLQADGFSEFQSSSANRGLVNCKPLSTCMHLWKSAYSHFPSIIYCFENFTFCICGEGYYKFALKVHYTLLM